MSNPLDAVLGRALSIRLNLQISLSTLPIVEEWMDIHLNRWLESVPLPPEMPMGHTAHFAVSVASDLSRLSWRAYGDPSGFIPKLIDYLQASRISGDDMDLIEGMGSTLEPKLVGSWVSVVGGQIVTGWHFCDAHAFASIKPFFGDHEAKARLTRWLDSAGIDIIRRFAQSIGNEVYSELEFGMPGVSIDDQLRHVSQAFEMLGQRPLPEHALRGLMSAVSPEIAVAVRIQGGEIIKVSALAPGLGNDVIAELCKDSGVGFDNKLTRLQGALRAENADRVEYGVMLGQTGPETWPETRPETRIDIQLIPTDSEDSLSFVQAMN